MNICTVRPLFLLVHEFCYFNFNFRIEVGPVFTESSQLEKYSINYEEKRRTKFKHDLFVEQGSNTSVLGHTE